MARKSIIPASKLRLEVLPVAQRKLWDELGATPEEFVLYGGTAIALRLGHRQSVDFDFFALEKIDPEKLLRTVSYLERAVVQQFEPQTLACRVKRGQPVSVSFFGLPGLRRIAAPELISRPGVKLASLIDLAATKMTVVTRRARAKDYIDVHALVGQAGIELVDALAAASVIYGEQFSPLASLKALTYFGEPELAVLPASMKRDLEASVRKVDLTKVAARIARFMRSAS
jgi:hypothetical protein